LPPDGVPDVRVASLTKSYGDVVAVDAIDLEIAPRAFFTMLGRGAVTAYAVWRCTPVPIGQLTPVPPSPQ